MIENVVFPFGVIFAILGGLALLKWFFGLIC